MSFADAGVTVRQGPIRKFHVFDARKVAPSRENTGTINYGSLVLERFSLSRFLISSLYTTVNGAR